MRALNVAESQGKLFVHKLWRKASVLILISIIIITVMVSSQFIAGSSTLTTGYLKKQRQGGSMCGVLPSGSKTCHSYPRPTDSHRLTQHR